MSNYPVWWETTITLYNKYTDPITKVVSWFRHVLTGCFWDNTGTMFIAGDVKVLTNDVICRIPENTLYKPKDEWKALPNDKLGNFFTLGQGDILIRGSVSDIVSEETSGHRSNDLIAKYKDTQDCIVVKRYSDNTGAGRCMPHYYAVGE